MDDQKTDREGGGMRWYKLRVAVSTACLLLIAATVLGCLGDRAADRTLTIHQLQSTDLPIGQFQIDTSQLPSEAIKSRSDRGSEGAPVTSLEIDQKYRVRIVLVPENENE
jgi:hypothetical protein